MSTESTIRSLMQVAHKWADEPNCPVSGRSDTLEIELRKAFASLPPSAAPGGEGVAKAAPSDLHILHLWDIHVGDPTVTRPITAADKVVFARAVLAAAVPMGDAEPTQPRYRCSKCGYHGPEQINHQRPNGTGMCGYIAAKVTHGMPPTPPNAPPNGGKTVEVAELRASIAGLNHLVKQWHDRAVAAGWKADGEEALRTLGAAGPLGDPDVVGGGVAEDRKC